MAKVVEKRFFRIMNAKKYTKAHLLIFDTLTEAREEISKMENKNARIYRIFATTVFDDQMLVTHYSEHAAIVEDDEIM